MEISQHSFEIDWPVSDFLRLDGRGNRAEKRGGLERTAGGQRQAGGGQKGVAAAEGVDRVAVRAGRYSVSRRSLGVWSLRSKVTKPCFPSVMMAARAAVLLSMSQTTAPGRL